VRPDAHVRERWTFAPPVEGDVFGDEEINVPSSSAPSGAVSATTARGEEECAGAEEPVRAAVSSGIGKAEGVSVFFLRIIF
jgi:hypothetical protein